MRPPRIGITTDVGERDEGKKTWELPADYPRSIMRAGGVPLVLPPTDDRSLRGAMLDQIDGLLIPGGADLDPALYGQGAHAKTRQTDPERQAFDLALLREAEGRRMPVLGICLGCQVMNVARGGSLHQHLPDVPPGPEGPGLVHSRPGDRTNAHAITVEAGSLLAAILPTGGVEANSRHHQAIDQVPAGLRVSARAPDGTIEAIEDPTYPFWLAVQWHPENLGNTEHARLFEALVRAAGEYRAARSQAASAS